MSRMLLDRTRGGSPRVVRGLDEEAIMVHRHAEHEYIRLSNARGQHFAPSEEVVT